MRIGYRAWVTIVWFRIQGRGLRYGTGERDLRLWLVQNVTFFYFWKDWFLSSFTTKKIMQTTARSLLSMAEYRDSTSVMRGAALQQAPWSINILHNCCQTTIPSPRDCAALVSNRIGLPRCRENPWKCKFLQNPSKFFLLCWPQLESNLGESRLRLEEEDLTDEARNTQTAATSHRKSGDPYNWSRLGSSAELTPGCNLCVFFFLHSHFSGSPGV